MTPRPFKSTSTDAYEAERVKEWKERKLMKEEDEELREMFLVEAAKLEKERMIEEAKQIREDELDAKWKKQMLEMEIEKQ